MGGRFAPANPATVAHIRAIAEPPQSPYRAGMSYFPERPVSGVAVMNQTTFGRYGLDFSTLIKDAGTIVAGTVTGGPAGAAIAVGTDVAGAYSSGSTVDQQRAARANYVGGFAVQGNVAAAQIILGALVPNVSGNEAKMWQAWLNQLQSSTTGQATLAQARQLGPYWPVGSTDTVTNYPTLKTFISTWAAQHPLSSGGSPLGALTTGGLMPWLVIGGAGVALLLLARRR